jgi:DedD protein
MEQLERAMDATPQELSKSQGWGSAPKALPGSDDPQTPVAATRTGVTAWVVQVGSFSSEENAKALLKRLKQGGYTAFIEQLRNEADLAYRVRVGPELKKISADNIRDELARDIDVDGIVMRYP